MDSIIPPVIESIIPVISAVSIGGGFDADSPGMAMDMAGAFNVDPAGVEVCVNCWDPLFLGAFARAIVSSV